jgi:hypothetical protein
MTTDPLHVQADSLRSFSQTHADVAAGLAGLVGEDGSGVETTHGPIASAVSTALSGVLDGRQNSLSGTSTTARTIADLLRQAAEAYARGDEQDAQRFTAAAEALQGKDSPGRGAAASSSGSPGADVAGQLGQVLGQVGQQVGQLAQSIAQPLQGLAQGLQQLPQQIMQGVQQAGQASGRGDFQDRKDEEERRPEEKRKDEHKAERDEAQPQAAAGTSAPAERAPVQAPVPRQRPAATHPQAD